MLAVAAADAADDVRATDLTILDVADLLVFADVFLLATTASDRQLKAAAERVEQRLRTHDRRPQQREGTPESGWVLLDYGDLICHLFSEDQREFYGLDRLWADVPRRDASSGEPLAPNVPVGAAGRSSHDRGLGR